MIRYLTYTVIALSLIACETVVDVELPERDSSLTVNALINPGSKIKVTVDASRGTLEAGELQEVANATITIDGSDGTSETTSIRTLDFLFNRHVYEFSFFPKPEVDYTIKVKAPGFDEVRSTTRIPKAVPIAAVDTASDFSNGYREGRIDVTFRDPNGLGDAYETKFYALIYEFDTTGGQFGFNPVVQELYAYYAEVGDFFGGSESDLLISDELFDGKSYTQRVNYDFQLPFLGGDSLIPDSLTIQDLFSTYLITELRTLSSDYYQFQTTYTKYQFSSGDPFAQPVLVYNNIQGGFGIFAGFNSSRDTLQVSQGLFPSPLD